MAKAKFHGPDRGPRRIRRCKDQSVPGQLGSGHLFEDKIRGGAIPKEFVTSVDEGIEEALTGDDTPGHPVDEVRTEL